MNCFAVLSVALFLTPLTWATDPSGPETPSLSRRLLRDAGYQKFRTGQYEKALQCYIDALHAAQAPGFHDNIAIANDLNDIGVLSEEMGRYDDAKRYYTQEL